MLYKGPYDSQKTEPEILKFWLDNKFYKPEYHAEKGLQSTEEMKKDDREAFSIINPPPNAYMRPHIGNVSGYAYQDVFLRFNRMLGKKVLGQPGKDHAGIQGEVVVEKIFIENKGKTKQDMGRDKFYGASYAHFEKLMPKVMADEQRIGLSSDFERNLFTLDPRVVDVVLGTFTKMFADKMVYKGVRIVNWDPVAQTTLADIDTERVERESELVYINYPLVEQRAWFLSFYKEDILKRIKSGEKTIETRALNPDEKDRYFGDIKAGDLIVCVDKTNESHLYRKVKSVQAFKSLDEAYNKLDWDKISSHKSASLEELKKFYSELTDGYLDKIQKNGLVAIELEELTKENYVTVATTRAETMLGDTAVIVNPKDKRYQNSIGKSVVLPIANREVPIITSARVDKEFGTGAVKLTPAHSYDDYVMMNEWNLQNSNSKVGYINIVDKSAKLTGPIPGKYKGMSTEEARKEVMKDLEAQGLILKREKHLQSVMVGERSKAVIEQIMSSQWFIDVEKLKKPAIDAVENDDVKIHPDYMKKKYLHWMENLVDWPVSRSLWWGYRIPVWYKGEIEEHVSEGGQIVETIDGQKVSDIFDAVEKGLAKMQIEKPTGEGWIQDPDVFDTWFSSGQWPYATLKAHDLMDTFYPTDIMETAYDILELWVSRMVMLGIYTQGEVPFRDVYLHGLVKAPDGQKMSKSKGNVIEPDTIINQFGADALRLLYIVGNKAGAGYPVSYEKLEGHKRFLNKIWNASKFIIQNIEDLDRETLEEFEIESLEKSDKKILDEIHDFSKKVKTHIEKYRPGMAAEILYQEFWHNFCDIRIEEVKSRLYTKDREGNPINQSGAEKASRISAQITLLTGLKTYLKLLHPFIPFITEAVWQELPHLESENRTIMYEKWPR